MVPLLQLLIFSIVFWVRRRYILGRHLTKGPAGIPYLYRAEGKHRVTHLHIGVESANGFPFIIRKERWYHRFLKSIGIASEIDTPNAELNRRLYFLTDYPRHLTTMLQSTQMQECIAQIFASPVKAIYATSGRIWAVIGGKDIQRPVTEFTSLVTLLDALSGKVAEATRQPFSQQAHQHRWIALTFVIAHFALFATALTGWATLYINDIHVINIMAMAVDGIYYGLAVLAVWFFAILFLLRGTSWVGWVIADFLLYGWIGVVVCSGYLVRDINISADFTAPVIRTMPILNKNCTLHCQRRSGKHTTTHKYTLPEHLCTADARASAYASYRAQDYICQSRAWFTYVVYTQHWRDGIGPYHYEATAVHYDLAEIGGHVDIPTHPGALGIEWVDPQNIRISIQ